MSPKAGRPAALEPRSRPPGQSVVPPCWVFSGREAGASHLCPPHSEVHPGPSNCPDFFCPALFPKRQVWDRIQTNRFLKHRNLLPASCGSV